MKWEVGKEYKTKDGKRARVYATDGADHTIHGAVLKRSGWMQIAWQQDGMFENGGLGGDANDLVPPPREFWVRVQPNVAGLHEAYTPGLIQWDKRTNEHTPPISTRSGSS